MPKPDSDDIYSCLWQESSIGESKGLIDQDVIVGSPLTTAGCMIRIAMDGLRKFTDFEELEAEIASECATAMQTADKLIGKVKSMSPFERDASGKTCALPTSLPLALATIARNHSHGGSESGAIINLDFYMHQTPHAT